MDRFTPISTLPPAARRELNKNLDDYLRAGQIPLRELVRRVNEVTRQFLPQENRSYHGGRVKSFFTERSIRHYQTLRCIDAPEKRGRNACYGLRHLLQALLVRMLLVNRVPADQIATFLAGRTTEDLERMLLGGVEIVARPGDVDGKAGTLESESPEVEDWKRVRLTPGVELHLKPDRRRLSPPELRQLLDLVKAAISRKE